jgi:hypothetical protein
MTTLMMIQEAVELTLESFLHRVNSILLQKIVVTVQQSKSLRE